MAKKPIISRTAVLTENGTLCLTPGELCEILREKYPEIPPSADIDACMDKYSEELEEIQVSWETRHQIDPKSLPDHPGE